MVNIPLSGKMSTISTRSKGYAVDRYYFVASNGIRTPIAEDSQCKEDDVCVQKLQYYFSPTIATVFFVGRRREVVNYLQPNSADLK